VPRRTIVLATDRVLFPCLGGNQARIVELIRGLRSAGFAVVLVGPPWLAGEVWWKPGVRSAVRTWLLADAVIWVDGRRFHRGSPFAFDDRPYRAALERAVARYRPAAVIAEYVWMAPCLDIVPRGVARLVDTHDVMHVRRAMYQGQPDGAWVECTAAEEARLLAHGDAIIAIQRHEVRQFERLVPGKPVLCVPHAVTGVPVSSRRTLGDVVAFVGSPNQGNLVGLRAFVREAWPVVRDRQPGAELRVYGDVADHLDVDAPGVRRLGRVRSIANAYAGAKVVVNPVTLGTGLKIKTVEALAHGKAVVTTSCGAAGIEEGAGDAFRLEDTMTRFGGAVLDLLVDERRRRSLEHAALRFAERHFSRSAALRELVGFLPPADGAAAVPVAATNVA
jgi:glycosyltransferase involved in cell wall biosynthesis